MPPFGVIEFRVSAEDAPGTLNAPEAHFRSAALAAPELFRTLIAQSAIPERRSGVARLRAAQLRSDTECHEVRSQDGQGYWRIPLIYEPR